MQFIFTVHSCQMACKWQIVFQNNPKGPLEVGVLPILDFDKSK